MYNKITKNIFMKKITNKSIKVIVNNTETSTVT